MVKLTYLSIFLYLVQHDGANRMATGLGLNDENNHARNLNVFQPKRPKKKQGRKQCIDIPDWRQSKSNCFRPHEGPGCDNKVCEAIICACDPKCCEQGRNWDAVCAGVDESRQCGARCDCLCSHQNGNVPGQEKPSRRPTIKPKMKPKRRPTMRPMMRPTKKPVMTPRPTKRRTDMPVSIPGEQQCFDIPDWRQSNSNCFRPHKGPGCDDAACEALICECDPSCCEEGNDWNALCAGVDESLKCGARCDCLCSHQGGIIPGLENTPKPTRRPTKPPTPRPTMRPTRPAPRPTENPGTIPGEQQCFDIENWWESNSNCFRPHQGPGCDDAACEALICACDPSCCEEGNDWNAECAGVDESFQCGARCDCLCSHQKS
mmetsp:Transcript_46067/g.55863  ORF Transcript_46067/g.55863 Transcript_46067/m.55863 type:complete len:375 (-) Transcript_46067:196-1320(-)